MIKVDPARRSSFLLRFFDFPASLICYWCFIEIYIDKDCIFKFVFVLMKEDSRSSTADDDQYYPEEGGDDFHDGITLIFI